MNYSNNAKEAIILAGGFGTRLGHLTINIPKPLVPINDVPFLSYIFEHLISNNFTNVILSVGYKYEKILNFYGDNYKSLKLAYSIEDKPLGTGGAIKKALNLASTRFVHVMNGDTFFNVQLLPATTNTIYVKYLEDSARYGTLIIKEDKILSLKEKSLKSGYINAGIYILSRKIFDNYEREIFSFENDFLSEKISELNFKIRNFDSFFIDIGVPEDYIRAQNVLKGIYEFL